MKRKNLLYGLAILVVGLMVLGVTHPGFSGEKRELRISVEGWMIQKFPMRDAVKRFEAEHPDVRVTLITKDLEEIAPFILEWSGGKTTEDLVLGPNPMKATAFVAKELVIDWSDLFAGDLAKDQWIQPFYNQAFIKGKPYVVPFMGEVEALIARRDYLAEAGLLDAKGEVKQPQSFEVLYEYAKKLTRPQRDGLHINGEATAMMRSYLGALQAIQGTIYAADGKSIDFGGKGTAHFLAWWQKAVKDGYVSVATFTEHYAARTAFKAGTTALMLEPNSRWVESEAEIGKEKVALMSIPGAEKNGSHTHVVGMVTPRVSPNQDLAKQFVRQQVMSKWFQQWSASRFGKMPVLQRNYDGLNDPGWKASLAAVSKAATYPNYKDYLKLESIVVREFQNCVRGKQTVDQTVKNVMAETSALDLTIY
jgi:ABC-type glycerol-3-phosphate transport system substrate-binding protein